MRRDWTPAPIQRAPRAGWIPAAFVLFSIFALLVGPLVLSSRIDSIRSTVIEPGHDARGEVNDIRHAITSGEAAVRGLLLTADPRFVETLREAQAEERRAFDRLAPLAWALDPELNLQVQALREQSDRASSARQALFDELRAGDIPATLLAREEERHARLLDNTEAVKTRIIVRTEAARAEVERIRLLGTLLTAALALLALVSALVVLRTGRAHRLRAREEAELRAAAFSMTEAVGVEEILGRIAAIAARTERGESGYVERIDRETGEVEVVAAVGEAAPAVGTRVPHPGSLSSEPDTRGEPEVLQNVGRLDRPIASALGEACRDCPALVIPLVSEHEFYGALVVIRPRGRGFGSREIEQRRAMGVLAALALRKALLLRHAREQHETLERMVESRKQLMRGFSHDVKNPLGAADGHAQLLADGVMGDLEPRQKESVLRIRRGIGSALELIGSLVDLARSEAAHLPTSGQPVDIEAILRETEQDYKGAADAAGLRLESRTDNHMPTVRSDPERIRQILGNLVSNGIKYTSPGGTVRLSAEARSGRRAGDPSWITVSVADTGPGIAREDQETLFQEFRRLQPDAAEGQGMGLASSARVAAMLGGEITLDSEPGKGSTFTLWLPG